jgi:hypothetical protein
MASPSSRFRLVIADAGGGVNRGRQPVTTVVKSELSMDIKWLSAVIQGLFTFAD